MFSETNFKQISINIFKLANNPKFHRTNLDEQLLLKLTASWRVKYWPSWYCCLPSTDINISENIILNKYHGIQRYLKHIKYNKSTIAG